MQGFPWWEGAWGAPFPHPTIFPNPPSKPHMGYPPYLKMKPLHLKNNPPLKREAPFHEMIPRKSTINNNLKSS